MSEHLQSFAADDLELVARKRDWVPMWFWINIVFRFELYDKQPERWIFCQSITD